MSTFYARALRMGALLFVFISLAAVTPRPGAGQATPGAPAIFGTVVDSAGRPLPSAAVTVTQLNRSTTTDGEGRFKFPGVRSGSYQLSAALIGYAPARASVEVPESGTAQVELRMHATALELSGLSVTASPTASDILDVAQATTEVSGKSLQRALGPTVAHTLASQPGISTRYAGPAAATPVIRGLTGERILVLENGDRTADLSAASSDHALTVDPLAASRIEVVRGPASLLYGNNALGGVVNVITNETPSTIPTHIDGYVATQGETASPGAALSGSVTLPVTPSFALTGRASGRDMDDVHVGGGDVQNNTYSKSFQGNAGFGLVRGNASAGGTVGRYGFEYGLPQEPGSDELVHLRGGRWDADARATWSLSSSGLTDVKLTGTGQWYHHDEVAADGAIGTSFKLNTQTVEATGGTRFGNVTGRVGAQGLFYQYLATGEEALTPAANSNSVGLFLFQDVPLGDPSESHVVHLQVGGRYDYYATDSKAGDPKFGPAQSSSFGSVSASVGLNIPLVEGTSLGLSAARAFRAPTVEELFSNAVHEAVGAYQVGTPDLGAETNVGFDAVLRVRRSHATGEVSGYYNRINNYIAPITVGDTIVGGETLPLDVFEQADARIYGIEGKVDVEVMPQLVLGVMGDHLRGDFLKGGGPLVYMPASRIGGSIRWDGGRVNVGGEVRRAFAQNHVAQNESATGAYTLVGLSAGLNLVGGGHVHTVTLRLDNALDEKYAEATSRIKDFAFNPGRDLTLVYRMLF